MEKASVSLIRTNVALTSNVKLVVDNKYNLYLESYNSNSELSNRKYKKFQISENSFLSERIARFYRELPVDLAFQVKNDIKPDSIQNTYLNQYDDIYMSGPKTIDDNRYSEEFQYNTTLQICSDRLPKYFFIFRLDGTGSDIEYENQAIFNDFKLISSFDLTDKTNLGKFWKKNYIDDDELPRSPLELNFKKFEFSNWNGYDYYTGGSVSKSFLIEEIFQNETTYYDLEKILTDGFRKNGVVSSNYTNVSFLFDDTVGDTFIPGIHYYFKDYPFILKLIKNKKIQDSDYNINFDNNGLIFYTFNNYVPYKKSWTINRYYGFYIDNLKHIDKISPYTGVTFKLNENIEIVNNVFKLNGDNVNPVKGSYTEDLPIYLKIENDYYLVERNNDEYLIVSDKIFNGLLDDLVSTAKPSIKIEYTDDQVLGLPHKSYIKLLNDLYYWHPQFDKITSGTFVIELFDKFYSLYLDHNNKICYINTDEYIVCDNTILLTKLADESTQQTVISVTNKDNDVPYFNIYACQYTQIKDFDFDRIDTRYSEIEYDKINEVNYNRPALYMKDIKDRNIPKDYLYDTNYSIWYRDQLNNDTLLFSNKFILPYNSEYAVSGDLYRVNILNRLIDIWSTNQYVNKWGINRSIGVNSYQYKINNSLTYSGIYNLSINPHQPIPQLADMNLDYFYTIGKPVDNEINNYLQLIEEPDIRFRTLNIDMPNIVGLPDIYNYLKFDINYYKDLNSINYFDYIFNLPVVSGNNLELIDKASCIQESDGVNGSEIFFRNFNAYINWIDLDDPNDINSNKKINMANLGGYSFAIIFTPRHSIVNHGKAGIDVILNKVHKNLLINIYINVPTNSFTSLCYRNRNSVYSEQNVAYTVYDDNLMQTNWVNSELSIESLTLNNLIKTININDEVNSTDYSLGVNFEIIEEKEKYQLNEIQLDPANNNNLILIFNNSIPFKAGSWLYLSGIPSISSVYNMNNYNYQIEKTLNNNTVIIKTNQDQSLNYIILNQLINSLIITGEKSVLPFAFSFKNPDKIKINTNVNSLEIDNNVPSIKPNNNSSLIQNLVISDIDNGIIPNVYTSDLISRKLIKKTNRELSYAMTEKLPHIYRYSTDYEPILNNIEIFNTNKLKPSESLDITTIGPTVIDTNNMVYIETVDTGNYDIKNGDLIYIYIDLSDSNNIDTNFIEYTTHTIFDTLQYNDGTNDIFRIYLSRTYDVAPINNTINVFSSSMQAYTFKYIESRYEFEYDYKNFATVNQIVAKTYFGQNPLKSSQSINDTINRYPIIDEHGSTIIKRNIFKSPWDIKYYYNSINNNYKKI